MNYDDSANPAPKVPLRRKYYQPEEHAYFIYEQKILKHLRQDSVVMDAGCGADAPVLRSLSGRAAELIGVDLVEFSGPAGHDGMKPIRKGLEDTGLADASVDLIISRSVLEHVEDAGKVYTEMNSILKRNGRVIFLVPNLWDYNSLISCAIPNKFHGFIVEKLSERKPEDTFSTHYKSNTRRSITRLAGSNGFDVVSLDYIGQYPYMFESNELLFLIGTAYDKFVSKYEITENLRGWILAELIEC